jgi:peptidoglycan/LPS O-acetylase OafA/YrhL
MKLMRPSGREGTMTAPPLTGGRFQGLDLLRAIAILVVALHHTWSNAVPDLLIPVHEFGWMGVDLFFVLSGYLIGSQLLRQYTTGRAPSPADFYARRALRILPAYLLVLTGYFLLPQLREQPEMAPLWKFLTFTMNLGFDRSKGGAFSHAWSLCVEEYFYLLFPVVCIALMHRPSLRRAVCASCFVAIAGAVVRLFSWTCVVGPFIKAYGADEALQVVYTEYIYYPTYTRLDGLLVGVILAAIRIFRPLFWDRAMQHGHCLGLSGLALVACAVWLFSDRVSLSATVVGFPILSIGLGLLLASSVSANGLLARVRIPGAGTTATLAYSLYLSHKAVMHLDRSLLAHWMSLEGAVGLLVYGGSSLAAAGMLHLCIERPCLRIRDRLLRRGTKAAPLSQRVTVP